MEKHKKQKQIQFIMRKREITYSRYNLDEVRVEILEEIIDDLFKKNATTINMLFFYMPIHHDDIIQDYYGFKASYSKNPFLKNRNSKVLYRIKNYYDSEKVKFFSIKDSYLDLIFKYDDPRKTIEEQSNKLFRIFTPCFDYLSKNLEISICLTTDGLFSSLVNKHENFEETDTYTYDYKINY